VPARDSAARKTFVVTVVALATLVGAIALWKLRVLVALLFLSLMIASAMRPGVERLARYRVPRLVGVLLHYAAILGLVALVLWFVVPQLLHEIEAAIGSVPETRRQLKEATRGTTGIKHDILVGLQGELRKAPSFGSVVHPALDLGKKALEILVGIFFCLASAAYWIFDRERAEEIVVRFVPRAKRKVVRDTWELVELKLGAYVRAQVLMICFVGTVLSFAFWQIGLPYWLMLGTLAGVVEIIPVIGPLLAGVVAVGVGLTVSFEAAALAALAVYGLRLAQDYVIGPRVLGGSVGLAPLGVLVVVSAVGILFGPALVPLATPFTAVVATLVDVIVLGRRPGSEPVPTVLFPSTDLDGRQAGAARQKRAARET
jgi:predicted PurR-regulated permease PerM